MHVRLANNNNHNNLNHNQNSPPTVRNPRRQSVLRRPAPPPVPRPPITTNDISAASLRAQRRRANRRVIEQALRGAGLVVNNRGRSPVAKHRRLQRTNARARQLGKKAMEAEDTAEELKQRLFLTNKRVFHYLY